MEKLIKLFKTIIFGFIAFYLVLLLVFGILFLASSHKLDSKQTVKELVDKSS